MRIVLAFPVQATRNQVKESFDRRLFEALAPPPPFPAMKILRFDGCQVGDVVSLNLKLLPGWWQQWTSVITEAQETDTQWEFVDTGQTLPFFLKSWQHRHRVIGQAEKGGCVIQEDISFTTPWWLPAGLLGLVMKWQFGMRGPVYQRIFGK